jgi:aspartate/methionine/tyrosine aminotransferase
MIEFGPCWMSGFSQCISIQVAALMEYPPLRDTLKDQWPSDVIQRAKELQEEIGSIGAYSHSKGVPLIRKHVAQFIEGENNIFQLHTFAPLTEL